MSQNLNPPSIQNGSLTPLQMVKSNSINNSLPTFIEVTWLENNSNTSYMTLYEINNAVPIWYIPCLEYRGIALSDTWFCLANENCYESVSSFRGIPQYNTVIFLVQLVIGCSGRSSI